MLRFWLLCSLVILLAAPAAAPAYVPIAVFRADHATAALPGPNGIKAVLRPDHGPRRTVARPDCAFWAAGRGHLVWDCGATLVVTDLHGGGAHAVPAPYYDADPEPDSHVIFQIAEVGTDWLAGGAGEARAQDWTAYFNWRTGELRTDRVDTSPRAYPDVDTPGLIAPLCKGARRLHNASDSEDLWGTMKVAGHWTLSTSITADEADLGAPRAVLHRCGTRDGIAIRNVVDSALSASWLAWADARSGDIFLRHLRTGRVFHTQLPTTDADQSVALTDAYVYSGRHRLRLPKD